HYNATLLSTGYPVRLGFGYTTNTWFWRAEGIHKRYANTNKSSAKIIKVFYALQEYAGFRLKLLKFMRSTVDWANDKSPIRHED
ncbi:hypothetical protein ABTM78_20550, partial [Acinetobacter baumannii]